MRLPTWCKEHEEYYDEYCEKCKIKELEAKIAHLSARGIEDMQHTIKELETERDSMLACLNEAKKRVDELWEVYKISVIIEGLDYWTSKTRTQAKGE